LLLYIYGVLVCSEGQIYSQEGFDDFYGQLVADAGGLELLGGEGEVVAEETLNTDGLSL
jgi:hypothetical protein